MLVTQEKATKSQVLMKGFNRACKVLQVNTTQASKILGVNVSTLSRNNVNGFSPESRTGEMQLHFIRLYRSLFAISGGDNDFMGHWYTTPNKALNGVPSILCQKVEGLIRANEYLDAMRGKV